MGGSKDGRVKWIMELEKTSMEGNNVCACGVCQDVNTFLQVSFTFYKFGLWFLDTSLQVSITSYIRGGE